MVVYKFDKLAEVHKYGCPDYGQLLDVLGRSQFQKKPEGSNLQVVKPGRVEEQIIKCSNHSREAVEYQWRPSV